MTSLDSMLDDLFHGAAFAAYVEEAVIAGSAPCPIATKHRAYQYYEQALTAKNNCVLLQGVELEK